MLSDVFLTRLWRYTGWTSLYFEICDVGINPKKKYVIHMVQNLRNTLLLSYLEMDNHLIDQKFRNYQHKGIIPTHNQSGQ